MNFKYKKIFMLFVFTLLSFFVSNIGINAKTVCSYDCNMELVNIGKNIELYVNGFLDNQYTIHFELTDNGYCPKNIYSWNSPDLYDNPSSFAEEDFSSCTLKQNKSNKVSCGNITGIPSKIPSLTSKIITILQIAIPVILVIMGSLDLFKGITAQKEDEIKKGQQIFIKRLIFAVLVFFIVVIVKFLVSLVAESSTDNIVECIDCFISNNC